MCDVYGNEGASAAADRSFVPPELACSSDGRVVYSATAGVTQARSLAIAGALMVLVARSARAAVPALAVFAVMALAGVTAAGGVTYVGGLMLALPAALVAAWIASSVLRAERPRRSLFPAVLAGTVVGLGGWLFGGSAAVWAAVSVGVAVLLDGALTRLGRRLPGRASPSAVRERR